MWSGHFGKKKSKLSNCNNLKVLGEVKCHVWNFRDKCAIEWIVQRVKYNFPINYYTA